MYGKEPERGEANPGETPRVKKRLPRLGCFSLFTIFFFGTFLLGMLVFQTTLARPLVCETPDPGEPVVVYDPCGILAYPRPETSRFTHCSHPDGSQAPWTRYAPRNLASSESMRATTAIPLATSSIPGQKKPPRQTSRHMPMTRLVHSEQS